jgi:NAD(P)-dependent dehydrogenase (short-subunit alcohol dehydrogenase family)
MVGHFSLDGKVAVVTGGVQGIGKAVATRLSEAGALVHIADLHAPSDGATSHQTDVSQETDVQAMIAAVKAYSGRLDIVVNNAGIHRDYATLSEMKLSDLEDCLAVNTRGVAQVIKHAAPLLEDAGAIVNIASMAAQLGVGTLGTYAASKAAVLALTRVAAIELADRGIRVNAICPGSVRTPMALADGGEDLLKVEAAATPLGRICEPEEVAALVHALVASDFSFMTGQAINLCGGLSAGISDTVWQAVAAGSS